MSWIETLIGFREEHPEQVRQNLKINGTQIQSKVNSRSFECGRLEIPTLETLMDRLPKARGSDHLKLSVLEADVAELHRDKANAGALFQAASQFNLLEMASPKVSPEQGVGIYEYDMTQGPACAISCGAGTIYRNYFAEIDGARGQTTTRQLNCLSELEATMNSRGETYWQLQNGYAFASEPQLIQLNKYLSALSESDFKALERKLQIGIQWDTEVTTAPSAHTVTQAYCSALPVGYSNVEPKHWAPFAKLVLGATYKATLAAAVLNADSTGNRSVFLTLVGGGVFNNAPEWIADAIIGACQAFQGYGLNCMIVSYGTPLEAQVIAERYAE